MKKEKSNTIALVGNPNCGKTTLFNLLTKSGEAVGNRAGVTFQPKKEKIKNFGRYDAEIIDLPGVYTLSSNGNEEKIVLSYLKKERPNIILNIIDATNLERGLFLTMGLIRLDIPIVIALNMIDEADKEGLVIDVNRLSDKIGAPVFPISAAKNIGILNMLHGCRDAIGKPSRPPILSDQPREVFQFIQSFLPEVITEKRCKSVLSDRIDTVICHPIVGVPLFFAVMSLIFLLTFSGIGGFLTTCLDKLFISLSEIVRSFFLHIGVSDMMIRFLIDGVFLGVSSVLSFLPQTAILFCLLAILEDSGYMARFAFVMDHLMRPFGLSGKAVIPMMIGFGCTVPAVMAATTLEEGEKENVIHSLPFVPCNARLPVLLFLVSSFFESHKALIASAFYLLSVAIALLSSLIFSSKNKTCVAAPLVIELPKYRMPRLRSLIREIENKLRDFIVRAGTVVFLSCVAINLFSVLTPSLKITENVGESILALIGNAATPIFSLLGFGNGSLIAALAAGFFAKESIISTIHILFPNGISSVLSTAGEVSFIAFSMLYTPCAATLSAMRKEIGARKSLSLLFRTLLIASLVSYFLYTIVRILTFF